jgi:hypothetical protein
MVVPCQTTVPLDRFMISKMDLIRFMRSLPVSENVDCMEITRKDINIT